MIYTSQKLTHKQRCVSWCLIMMQNPLLVFPQFCAFLTNCFAQSAHNFKLVFLIDHTTLSQEFMKHHAIAIEENSEQAKPTHMTEFDVLFSVLTYFSWRFYWYDRTWFQCRRHILMIRQQLWPFWANLVCRWTSSTYPERMLLLKIQQLWNNLRCRLFQA